ncbi:hypothetical protein GGI12_000918 [Dipsacomyces acuminosporus]|nr:hypothetical protein GGI12_000918 [Dipsacomyces acuminosporus]
MKNEVSTGSATTAAVSDDGNSPASVAPTPSPSPPDGGKNDADAPSASTYHLDNRQRLKAQRHGVSARRTWNKKTPPSKFLFFHSANSPTNADKGMPGLLSSISPPPATPHSAPPAGTQHRKRAMASPRASGQPTKTLAVPDELTPLAILPEEPNGITSIFAISIVLIFATFVAF